MILDCGVQQLCELGLIGLANCIHDIHPVLCDDRLDAAAVVRARTPECQPFGLNPSYESSRQALVQASVRGH